MRRRRGHPSTARRRWSSLATGVVLAMAVAGCNTLSEGGGGSAGGGVGGDGASGETVTMARANWDTGWFQAEIYRQLIGELGYVVTDPADATRDANGFYPALARGEFDVWANGWFPLHEPYQTGELFTGSSYEADVTPIGLEVDGGALQGYLVDKATADELGLTTMSDLADASVAETFDTDGNGKANLVGCNDGWGCNLTITEQIDTLDWGANVEQVVGDYSDQFEDVIGAVEAGDPVLFYTWTPNWTLAELTPGEDVVWLASPALPDAQGETAIDGLAGCAGDADPCELGWEVNDIQAVGNTEFLDSHPDVAALLEAVTIPLDDIEAQNDAMRNDPDYDGGQLEDDAAAWIADNQETVDGWIDTARGAG